MHDLQRRLKDLLNEQANVRLARLGHSEAMIRDAKREAWWWLQARAQAFERRTRLLSGRGVVWTVPGRVELVRVEVPRAGEGKSPSRCPSYWVGGFSGRAHSSWRASREQAGGGLLIMNLCHNVDLVRHLTGGEADLVTARAHAMEHMAEVEDAVSVSVRYSNGALGSFFGTAALRGSDPSTELRLWGDDGQLMIEPKALVYTLRAVDGLLTGRWQTFGPVPQVNGRAIYFSRLATAIYRGETPDVTSEDGLAVQEFIEAAYQSSESG